MSTGLNVRVQDEREVQGGLGNQGMPTWNVLQRTKQRHVAPLGWNSSGNSVSKS